MSDVTKRQTCDQFRPVLYIVRLKCEMTAWKNCDSNKRERERERLRRDFGDESLFMRCRFV